MGDWSVLTPQDHRVLREDVGLEPLPVQLGLQPEKGHRQSDQKQQQTTARKKTRRKTSSRRKPATRRRSSRHES